MQLLDKLQDDDFQRGWGISLSLTFFTTFTCLHDSWHGMGGGRERSGGEKGGLGLLVTITAALASSSGRIVRSPS